METYRVALSAMGSVDQLCPNLRRCPLPRRYTDRCYLGYSYWSLYIVVIFLHPTQITAIGSMIIISVLFFSAFFGGLSVFIVKKDNTKLLTLILAFSGSYIFAITILQLIPGIYSSGDETIGLYVLGGFLFQLLLEQFSAGIEHGHLHQHKLNDHTHTEKHVMPVGVM